MQKNVDMLHFPGFYVCKLPIFFPDDQADIVELLKNLPWYLCMATTKWLSLGEDLIVNKKSHKKSRHLHYPSIHWKLNVRLGQAELLGCFLVEIQQSVLSKVMLVWGNLTQHMVHVASSLQILWNLRTVSQMQLPQTWGMRSWGELVERSVCSEVKRRPVLTLMSSMEVCEHWLLWIFQESKRLCGCVCV